MSGRRARYLSRGTNVAGALGWGQVDVRVEPDAHFALVIAPGFETTATILCVALSLTHIEEILLDDRLPVGGRDRVDMALDS